MAIYGSHLYRYRPFRQRIKKTPTRLDMEEFATRNLPIHNIVSNKLSSCFVPKYMPKSMCGYRGAIPLGIIILLLLLLLLLFYTTIELSK